jgi:hypothetical protein
MVIWLKGLAIGFATGALTVGVVSLMSHGTDAQQPGPARPSEPSVLAAVASPAARPPDAKVQALSAEQTADVPPLPPLQDTSPASETVPSPASETVPSPVARPNRAEELATLDSVRAALVAKNARAALAELDRYESRYPSLSFGLQAQLLRIEALAATGQPQAARELAAGFVSANPDSPHAPRLRAFVAGEAWSRARE